MTLPQAAVSSHTEKVTEDNELPPRWVRVAITLTIVGGLMVGVLFMFADLALSHGLIPLVSSHPAAFIGVPWAGGASFSVVLICRASFGM